MGDTTISWCDKTWNVTRGCRRVSAGCEHCYAERQANRFRGPGQPYEGLVQLVGGSPRWSGRGTFVVEHLTDPLTWRRPCRVFVDSMSDLFYDAFTNEEIAAVFGVMAAAPQHTFQILTKRPQRALEWFEWMKNALPLRDSTFEPRPLACWDFARRAQPLLASSAWNTEFMAVAHTAPWPLQNVWIGVSVEDQHAANTRIPLLLSTPASVRFLSMEPLLGPVDLTRIGEARGEPLSALDELVGFVERPPINWVIAGCESGPGARPCEAEWLRVIRNQCGRARVPFFLKQAEQSGAANDFAITARAGSKPKSGNVIERPYLDGMQHLAFPVVTA